MFVPVVNVLMESIVLCIVSEDVPNHLKVILANVFKFEFGAQNVLVVVIGLINQFDLIGRVHEERVVLEQALIHSTSSPQSC